MRHYYLSAFAVMFIAGAFAADRHRLDIDPESQDGILLQRIRQEPTKPRRTALLERFVVQFPKASSLAWVYEQLLPVYAESQQPDKVLATAEALLSLDPDDLDSAHSALQVAESRKDPELIRRYAERCWDIASKTVKAPKPADPDLVHDWSKEVQFATDVLAYSEYLLSDQASQETDPQKKAELVQALQSRNPQSKYLAVAKADPLHTTRITLSPEKAFQMAVKGLPDDPDNEDFLMTIADYDLGHERDLPRVLSYSLRILEILQRKSRPDDVSAAEWTEKVARYTGWANWMAGVVYGKQARYGLSDRHLRAALAYIHEDSRLLAAAYFYLGYDNYAMAAEQHDKGRAIDAARYSKLCAAIDGPFQPLAQRNLEALRSEYNIQ